MKTSPSLRHPSQRLINARRAQPGGGTDGEQHREPGMFRREIRVICLYPTVQAGKIARNWIEVAVRNASAETFPSIEYFNYTVLEHDAIRWEQVIGGMEPDIILMVGDGKHPLGAGLRNSLRNLFSQGAHGRKPLVVFRDLEPEPTLNTRILLDYVSALSHRNHCQLNAMDGNGTPISCFRNPRHLLAGRYHRE